MVPALLLLLIRAGEARPQEPQDKKLEGKWELVAVTKAGEKMEVKDEKGQFLTIKGTEAVWRVGDREQRAEIIIDPPKKAGMPGMIDLKPKEGPNQNKKIAGLYKLKDKTLVICLAEPEKPRPTEFGAEKESGTVLFTFRRVD
jgi:uncharacterized protein (TIGR03067 family)